VNIVASAPGKVVLLGEYAVLEGAPALSMAVDRRAVVKIESRAGEHCHVHAPDILDAAASLKFSANGEPQWADAAAAKSLALVDQVLRGLGQPFAVACQGLEQGFDLRLDTSAFFDASGGQRHKLGLGSSAALTVALASALSQVSDEHAASPDRNSQLDRLLRIHRDFQGGQGSGVDVATSLVGGLIEYRIAGHGKPAQALPIRWPASVRLCFVWSGSSASTPKLLGTLRAWRSAHAADYAAHMVALSASAEAGAAAVREQNAESFLSSVAQFSKELLQLDRASGLGIFSAEHLRLAELARKSAVIYKSCGAGGGDVGAAFALDPASLRHFAAALESAGFRCVPMSLDDEGLRLEFMENIEA
jgi:phosphomevalonate kinase